MKGGCWGQGPNGGSWLTRWNFWVRITMVKISSKWRFEAPLENVAGCAQGLAVCSTAGLQTVLLLLIWKLSWVSRKLGLRMSDKPPAKSADAGFWQTVWDFSGILISVHCLLAYLLLQFPSLFTVHVCLFYSRITMQYCWLFYCSNCSSFDYWELF